MATIYCLVDPRTDCLRYVGRAANLLSRFSNHLAVSGVEKTPKARWILKLLKLGLKPQLAIIEELPEAQANDAERFWIASLRAAGAMLLNMTDGGEGSSRPRPDVRARLLGTHPSAETKAKIGASNRGKKRSLELRNRISDTVKSSPFLAEQLRHARSKITQVSREQRANKLRGRAPTAAVQAALEKAWEARRQA